MTPRIRPVLVALALLLAGAAPDVVQLDARRCQSLPAREVAALGPDWAALLPYVQRCAIHGPDGRLALSVDIVRLDRAHATDFFASHPHQVVPTPVLRDATGVVIGDLEEGFPVDPPGRLRVRFIDWYEGFPREIRLYQAGESALPPHPLPFLRWNPEVRRYE